MTDYVTRDDTNLGVGRILTSPTLYALYDNPTAIAEGAAGAPRIEGVQGPVVDTGGVFDSAITPVKTSGRFVGHVSATSTTAVGWTALSPLSMKFDVLSAYLPINLASPQVQFRLSTNNGSTWGGFVGIFGYSVAGGDTCSFRALFRIDMNSGVWKSSNLGHSPASRVAGVSSGTVAGGPFNAIQFRNSVADGATIAVDAEYNEDEGNV